MGGRSADRAPPHHESHEEFILWVEFEAKLNTLEISLNANDVGVIPLMMQQLAAGYTSSDDIVDWVCLGRKPSHLL